MTDASTHTYGAKDPADWLNSASPLKVDVALDQLADRLSWTVISVDANYTSSVKDMVLIDPS